MPNFEEIEMLFSNLWAASESVLSKNFARYRIARNGRSRMTEVKSFRQSLYTSRFVG